MNEQEAAAEYYEAEMIYARHNDCECGYCTHVDDPEQDLETRLDLAETALLGIRTHLWKLEQKLDRLTQANK